MQITSNTLGKLSKIRNGKVFSEPLTFIKEFIQNCQRSKAGRLNINVYDDCIEFLDNGCGCKKPENVFTLDLSSWDTTKEGFGIGFWSCLNIPELTTIEVKSLNWEASVDVLKLFSYGDLNVNLEKTESTYEGFSVKLYSPYFKENEYEIFDYTKEVAKYIDNLDVYFNNGSRIAHEDIFDSFNPVGFVKEYDNNIFRAKLFIPERGHSYIESFYDKRNVCALYEWDYIAGVIEFKTDKVTLKEPDRTSFIRDNKYYNYRNKLRSCIVDFYKTYISLYGIDEEKSINGIAYYLSVRDFERFLDFDADIFLKEKKEIEENTSYHNYEESISLAAAKTSINTNEVELNKKDYEMEDMITNQHIYVPSKSYKKAPENEFSKHAKELKKCVWLRRDEEDDYKDVVAKARYCKIKVIVAKNKLYEIALQNRNVIHISELEDCLEETIIKKDIELKTKKEEIFIKLLYPICKKYDLPLETFRIANLEKITTFKVDGKVLFKESLKNKKGSIKTYGLTNRCYIYLDRTALSLNKFSIHEGKIGIHELKAVMNAVNTIAHELAHFLYNTTDNTVEHYNREIKLQEEIMALYL